jgi:hypothetical protein
MTKKSDRGRENHLFCGCCCDSRRATIVVNVVAIVCFATSISIGFLAGVFVLKNGLQNMNDDRVKQLNPAEVEGQLFAGMIFPAYRSSCAQLESMVPSSTRLGLKQCSRRIKTLACLVFVFSRFHWCRVDHPLFISTCCSHYGDSKRSNDALQL